MSPSIEVLVNNAPSTTSESFNTYLAYADPPSGATALHEKIYPDPTLFGEPEKAPVLVETIKEEPIAPEPASQELVKEPAQEKVKESYTDQAPVLVPTASLHGKVALITGGSRGIGAGIALSLAKRGASIVINYVSSEKPALSLCEEIKALNNGARATAIQADVAQPQEITRLFEDAIKQMGKIDIVMSNSGTESWDDTATITEEKFDAVFALNCKAQFFVGQAALNYCQPGGRLVLMSSIAAGLLGVQNHALYNSSKMAVIGMTKAFATDFATRKGMTVNAVAPGGIKSDMFTSNAWHYIPGATPDWSADAIESAMANHCPLGRCAVPEDVGRVVGFLCSDDGGWINGQVITISGGSSQ